MNKSDTGQPITEFQFSLQVEDLLKIFGWRWTHFLAARSTKGYITPIKGYKGFTDYVAVRDGILLFIELKSEKGKLTPEQEIWIDMLKAVAKHSLGIMVFVWRPSDLQEIIDILKG